MADRAPEVSSSSDISVTGRRHGPRGGPCSQRPRSSVVRLHPSSKFPSPSMRGRCGTGECIQFSSDSVWFSPSIPQWLPKGSPQDYSPIAQVPHYPPSEVTPQTLLKAQNQPPLHLRCSCLALPHTSAQVPHMQCCPGLWV